MGAGCSAEEGGHGVAGRGGGGGAPGGEPRFWWGWRSSKVSLNLKQSKDNKISETSCLAKAMR